MGFEVVIAISASDERVGDSHQCGALARVDHLDDGGHAA